MHARGRLPADYDGRVSVRKGLARLVSADGLLIGEGRAYLHLRQPDTLSQSAQGTLSMDWWDDALSTSDARLELVDGPSLALRLESDPLSGCLEVIAFQARRETRPIHQLES